MHCELGLYIHLLNDCGLRLFICWLEWFVADWADGGIVVFPQLFLGQPFHRDFIGKVLYTDGCYD